VESASAPRGTPCLDYRHIQGCDAGGASTLFRRRAAPRLSQNAVFLHTSLCYSLREP